MKSLDTCSLLEAVSGSRVTGAETQMTDNYRAFISQYQCPTTCVCVLAIIDTSSCLYKPVSCIKKKKNLFHPIKVDVISGLVKKKKKVILWSLLCVHVL